MFRVFQNASFQEIATENWPIFVRIYYPYTTQSWITNENSEDSLCLLCDPAEIMREDLNIDSKSAD